MKKERLVSLKQIINQDFTERHDVPQLHFNQSDLRWLIEQAEQKERFEKLHQNYATRYRNVVSENNELNEENTRLRESLKFYADEDNYNLTAEAEKVALCEYIHMVDMDNGDKARKALESDSK